MDKAKIMKAPELAKLIGVGKGSIGDLIRMGTIPEPFNWPQMKNWYWIRSEIVAWDAKRREGLAPDMVPAPVVVKEYWPIDHDTPYPEREVVPVTPIKDKYCPFIDMPVYTSFYIPETCYDDVGPNLYKQAKYAKVTIRTPSENGGVRVWRDA